jgi:hypothetical protein
MRGREQVRRMFDGWTPVAPGVVLAPEWRPDHPDQVASVPVRASSYVGVGRRE